MSSSTSWPNVLSAIDPMAWHRTRPTSGELAPGAARQRPQQLTHRPLFPAMMTLPIFCMVILAGCFSTFRTPQPLFRDMPVTVHQLENGLTVSIQEDPSIPLVTLDMWVGVGSGDEPAEIAGVSHFLEHMLFKGTARLATGEYDRRIEEVGGYLNAATSTDYTHYYTVFPAEHFDRILEDFSDVLLNSLLDEREIESERQVILEEISRKQDSPFGYLFDESFPLMFESGPYTHPVIGSAQTVSALTRDQLVDHYERFYTPENMYLSVVGDIHGPSAINAIREAFGGLDRPFRPHRDMAPETVYSAPMDRILPRDWAEAYFILAFPAPDPADARSLAVRDLAETLLVGGKSSRLVNSLQEKRRLVSSIGGYFPEHRHPAPLLLYGTCQGNNIHVVRSEVFRELERLQAEGMRRGELERIRRLVLNSQLFSLETGRQRAAAFGHALLRHHRIDIIDEYRREVNLVGSREILEFLDEHLREDNASFFVTRRNE
ncbi:MAG: insulinase family protein [Candidatus Sumerlaeia bacterium]|nr:insulinase family protein [Candidatus Sumerlaeia bacterium]